MEHKNGLNGFFRPGLVLKNRFLDWSLCGEGFLATRLETRKGPINTAIGATQPLFEHLLFGLGHCRVQELIGQIETKVTEVVDPIHFGPAAVLNLTLVGMGIGCVTYDPDCRRIGLSLCGEGAQDEGKEQNVMFQHGIPLS